jgi:hypothetical protein
VKLCLPAVFANCILTSQKYVIWITSIFSFIWRWRKSCFYFTSLCLIEVTLTSPGTTACHIFSCLMEFSHWTCVQKLNRMTKVKISRYDLYYFLIHSLKWKPFWFETYTDPYYLVLNFYQIDEDDKIWTRDRLIIKVLIPCQRTIST